MVNDSWVFSRSQELGILIVFYQQDVAELRVMILPLISGLCFDNHKDIFSIPVTNILAKALEVKPQVSILAEAEA